MSVGADTMISATRGASTRTCRAKIVSPSTTISCFATPPSRVALPPARMSADISPVPSTKFVADLLEQRFDAFLRGRRDLRSVWREEHRDLGAHAELTSGVQARSDGEARAGG